MIYVEPTGKPGIVITTGTMAYLIDDETPADQHIDMAPIVRATVIARLRAAADLLERNA